MKKIKTLRWHIFGFSVLILLFAALLSGQPVEQYTREFQNKTNLIPVNSSGENEIQQRFEYDVTGLDGTGQCLIFFTGHQIIHVYADDMEIYSLETGNDLFSSTTGAKWNYVNLPPGTQKIVICLTAIYSNLPMKSFQVYVGNAREDILGKLRNSFGNACIDFLIAIIGVVLILFWMLERKNTNQRKTILYFGFFVLFFGLWCLNETEFATILIQNRCGASFFAFTMLMLIPIPYVKYADTFFNTGKNLFSTLIIAASILNACICIPLHLAGVAALKQTAIITHILLIASVSYLIYVMILYYRRNGLDRALAANLIGMTGIAISALIDLLVYYTSMQKNPVMSHFALLLSVLVLGYSAISDAKKDIEEIKHVHFYKEIALKDIQTGLFNRNAYDKWIDMEQNFSGTAIIVFDINNLKKCNDTYGREAGDSLICRSAELLAQVFGRKGRIYRIGGDEFCAALQNATEKDVTTTIHKFKELQSHSDKTDILSIACGYAFFDPKTDTTIEDTRKRADRLLYEDKENMKKEN